MNRSWALGSTLRIMAGGVRLTTTLVTSSFSATSLTSSVLSFTSLKSPDIICTWMLPFSFSQGLHLAQKESQDFALELETETELGLEAKLPVEFELELVDNFHGIHFLEVFI